MKLGRLEEFHAKLETRKKEVVREKIPKIYYINI